MRALKQAAVLVLVTLATAQGQGPGEGKPVEIDYKPPVVEKKLWDQSLNMLDQERREYATNLASYAANLVIDKKGSPESLEDVRRILGLAMHLDDRNRQALIVNGQLRRGVLPVEKVGDYNPRTFSRLLHSRAKLLARSDKEAEQLLARCFVELASMIDPRNEDAVFAFELQRLDDGEVDWRLITDAAKDKPSRAPAPGSP